MKLNNTFIIGLTGGIATGKSTVSYLLRKEGFPVIDADEIAKKAVDIGKPAYKDIVNIFGKVLLNEDLTINRDKLGQLVFNDRKLRRKLNEIVHPRVTEEIIKEVKEQSKTNKVIFLDIPLLIEEKDKLESGGLRFNEIWLIYANESQQLERLMARNNLDKESALKRIKVQMPIEEKRKYADIIIDNTKDLDYLQKEVVKLVKKI